VNSAVKESNLPTWEDISVEEMRRLSAKAMDENIHILQVIAEADRRDLSKPSRRGVFVVNPKEDLTDFAGTIDGSIVFLTATQNVSLGTTTQAYGLAKVQNVGT
jgi:hypothetical protein